MEFGKWEKVILGLVIFMVVYLIIQFIRAK
jgi:cell division protein FtsL